jgi:hypothetical protein
MGSKRARPDLARMCIDSWLLPREETEILQPEVDTTAGFEEIGKSLQLISVVSAVGFGMHQGGMSREVRCCKTRAPAVVVQKAQRLEGRSLYLWKDDAAGESRPATDGVHVDDGATRSQESWQHAGSRETP